jgi:hypothetical protein
MVDGATLSEVPEGTSFTVRPIDLVTVKGKRNYVTIRAMLDGHSEERLEKKLATRELYNSAFQSFEFGVYDEAAQLCRDVAKQDPEARAARAMMLKARKLAEGEGLHGRVKGAPASLAGEITYEGVRSATLRGR